VKVPLPVPSVVREFVMVGPEVIAQQTPLAVIAPLPSEVIFHLSDLIVGLAASPNEADSLIQFKYFFDWQRLFLLLRDEDMLHGNTQHFSSLNSNFFGGIPMLPDIYPAYIIPIL